MNILATNFLREKVISILNENLCSLKKPVHGCLLAAQFLITKLASTHMFISESKGGRNGPSAQWNAAQQRAGTNVPNTATQRRLQGAALSRSHSKKTSYRVDSFM